MAFDEGLAQRIRTALGDREGIREQKMFGGIAFMDHGNMAVGITGDTLMARVSSDAFEDLLGEPGAHPMRMGERTMKGILGVSPVGTSTDEQLRAWIERCLAHTATLPPK
jgi:TfoX/Sxy family transcriptional regulator of competence genes